jgi:hypothetical protein
MSRPVYMILRDAARELRQMHAYVKAPPGDVQCTAENCPSLRYSAELDALADDLVRCGHLGIRAQLPSSQA